MRIVHHRWSHALAAGLLLAGCKSNKDKEAAPPAQATAPAAKPVDPAPAPAPAPVTDATLSYLEPTADGKCRWMRHTPPGEPKAVSTFSFACEGVELSWKADGKEGLAFVRDSKPTVLRVDFETGASTPLTSLPTLGSLGTIGFDAQGRVVALMSDEYVDAESAPAHLKMVTEGKGDDEKKFIVFEGQRYPAAMDGVPGLAHAFRLEGTTWKRFETKDSSFGWDYAAEYKAVDAYDALAPTSGKLGSDEAKNSAVPQGSPVLASLKKAVPDKPKAEAAGEGEGEGEGNEDMDLWVQIETAGGPLYLLEFQEGEFPSLSGPVFTQGEKGLVQVEDLGKNNTLKVNARGELLLFQVRDGEGKFVAKLWNVKTKKFIASLPDKQTLTFWPKPSSSETGTKAPVAGPTTP